MIDRLTHRSQFQLLRLSGENRRSGPLRARVVLGASPVADHGLPCSVRLGFTIGRSFGSAVDRNRMRRRLRHSASEACDRGSVGVTHVLMGADRAALQLPYPDLVAHCANLMAPVGSNSPGRSGRSAR
ncbi:MAG: hypothetical protein HKN03_08585 [Acidimicrobiales bacterium]|nr:hypothetical protein [Acidimicrobiales bacterium]